MTRIELAREIAYRTKPRFLEIERLCRYTAATNEQKRRSAEGRARITALLEKEHRRLVRTWKESY